MEVVNEVDVGMFLNVQSRGMPGSKSFIADFEALSSSQSPESEITLCNRGGSDPVSLGKRVVHDIEPQEHHNHTIAERRIVAIRDGFNCSTNNAPADLFGCCFEADLLDEAHLQLPRHQQACTFSDLETECSKRFC
jgi:hypothetical protein